MTSGNRRSKLIFEYLIKILTKNTQKVPHTDCSEILQVGKEYQKYVPPSNCTSNHYIGAEQRDTGV